MSGEETLREILARLARLEAEHQVRIIYACESGSRAWGFASTDSDFDVRFLYLHRPEWYLSLDVESRRDVIEMPIDGPWDLNGWDLRKALRLLRKSNPPLFEWLQSPLRYLERTSLPATLRRGLADHFSPTSCRHHYFSMARGNFREFLQGEEVWVKKYFYVLRPLLACRWIARGLGVPPIEFQTLLEKTVEEPDVKQAITELLDRKRAGVELARGPRIPVLNQLIEQELALEGQADRVRPGPAAGDDLDACFRRALAEAWDG